MNTSLTRRKFLQATGAAALHSGWGTAEIPGGDASRLKDIAERMDWIFAS